MYVKQLAPALERLQSLVDAYEADVPASRAADHLQGPLADEL